MFEIAGNTIKYFEKEKNGDDFQFEDLKSEGILITLVSDGVSRQPCDWYASELTCKTFFESFKANTNNELKARIEECVQLTNEAVCQTTGECATMNATLSLIVWNYQNSTCFVSNIGDSRVYQSDGESITQITKDDSIEGAKQIMTELGKRKIETSSLTNAIGMPMAKIEVHEIEFKSGETLLLATDGFFTAKKATFQKDLKQMANSSDLEGQFAKCFSSYEFWAQDDMTAIVIKNN